MLRTVSAVLGLLLTACSSPPAEQRLRETVAAMEAAIEAGDVGDFIGSVAVDFSGNAGQYDRRQLHAVLRAMALRHRDISVVLAPLDVVMHGENRATVAVSGVVTGSDGGLLPESGRRLEIQSGWRLDNGDWRCISAQWRE